MATRAKFVCSQTTQYMGGSKQAVLSAVTDDGDPENKAFWSATPSGRIEIHVSNPDAAEQFEAGKAYYVDFTEVA
jgi:hypothetical protein